MSATPESDTPNAAASTAAQVQSPRTSRVTRAPPTLARSVGLRRSENPRAKRNAVPASTAAHTAHEGRSTCEGNEVPRPAILSMLRMAGPEPCASITRSGATVSAITAVDAARGVSGLARCATSGSALCATDASTSSPHSGHLPNTCLLTRS